MKLHNYQLRSRMVNYWSFKFRAETFRMERTSEWRRPWGGRMWSEDFRGELKCLLESWTMRDTCRYLGQSQIFDNYSKKYMFYITYKCVMKAVWSSKQAVKTVVQVDPTTWSEEWRVFKLNERNLGWFKESSWAHVLLASDYDLYFKMKKKI